MKKFLRPATLIAAALCCSSALTAQAPPDSVARRQQRTLDSLAAALRTLQLRIDSLTRARAAGDTSGADELAALRAAASATADSSTSAAQPQQARLGQNALNPEISVTGDVRVSAFNPGPQTDNFVPREFEFGFQSALDPFSTAKITLTVEDGDVGIEEGYLYFTALPGHLRLDLGQFRQQVGELNRWHLHALPEDEYPLVLRRYAGEEGVSGAGASIYWPLPFSGKLGAYELTLQATTGANDVLFAGGRRPSVNGQLSGFWQLSRATYAQVSVSGLYGTSPDTGLTTQLGTVAARFSWRPPQRGQARELTLRGELWVLHRTITTIGYDATVAGGFADLLWKLNRRWTFSMRGDWLQSPDPGPVAHEWAITPTLTFWQSEFVFLRALYEHAQTTASTNTDRLTLQVVFAMGPHKHELF